MPPPINNAAATVNIAVQTNSSTAIPRQVLQGVQAGQRIANQNPIRLNLDAKGFAAARRQLQLPLGQISKDAGEFEKSMKAATSRVVAFGAAVGSIYAIQRALGALVTTSIDVEQKLKQIQVISNGSVSDFQKFTKGIFDIGRQTSTSFKDASDAALEFARQGLSLSEQLKRTKDSMTLVKVSGVEVGQAVSSITAALNTFNTELKDSTDLVDRLTGVDNAFAVSATDLAEGLARVGNSSQEAGVSLNETLGAITALQQRTARGGAVIGNALKSIFTRIGRADNVELLNSLGIATETVSGKTRDAVDVLKDLAGVYKTLNDEQKKQISSQIAGLYQINQFQALIKDLGSSYSFLDQAAQKAGDSQGSAAKRVEELNKTIAARISQTGVNLTELSSQLGKLTFESPLKSLLETFGANDSILTKFNELLSSIGTNAESSGATIANGILKGIGNFITGPGVIYLFRLLAPILKTMGGFVADIFKQNVFVSQSMKEQIQLQSQINNALANASETERFRINNAKSLNQQLELTLQLLRAQQQIVITPLTSGLRNAGVRPGNSAPVVPMNAKITKASGYSPVEREMMAVKTSSDYAGHRSAKPKVIDNFSIGGRKQSIIVNSAEKIIPTRSLFGGYSGPDKYSILNPRQQKTMGFGNGYVPNLAKVYRGFAPGRMDLTGMYGNRNSESIEFGKEVLSNLNKYHGGSTPSLFYGAKTSGHIPGVTYSTSLNRDVATSFAASPDHLVGGNLRIFSDKGNERLRQKFVKKYGPSASYNDFLLNIASKKPFGVARSGYEYENEIRAIDPNRLLKLQKASSGYVPNLAKSLKLSTGAIINPSKQYVFRSADGSIANKERVLSRGTGFETITAEDLLELSKLKRGKIPALKIYDPTRSLQENMRKGYFLDSPKLKEKLYISQAASFGGRDKFQETQIASGFEKSIDLKGANIKTGLKETLGDLTSKLGNKFYVKGKDGSSGDSIIKSQQLRDLSLFSDRHLTKFAKHGKGEKAIIDLFRKFRKNPGSFFAQQAIQGSGDEYRIPIVGTKRGAVPIGIYNRDYLNGDATSYNFSDPTGKFSPISSMLEKTGIRDNLSAAQNAIKSLPTKIRNRFVGGLDVLNGKIVELNPSDELGYSGALDNPSIRGRTADVLRDAGKFDVERATKIGKKILNYSGSNESRQARFNQFNKSLLNLKKVDEIAYYQIAANLGRSGFGIQAGKRSLSTSSISKYFSRRGFAGGFSPAINDAINRESQFVPKSSIYVDHVKTHNYSGPVVANTRDEPNRAALLRAANNRASGGYVPNLIDNREINRNIRRNAARQNMSDQVEAGIFKPSSFQSTLMKRDFSTEYLAKMGGLSGDDSLKKLKELSSKTKRVTPEIQKLKTNMDAYVKAQVEVVKNTAKQNKVERDIRVAGMREAKDRAFGADRLNMGAGIREKMSNSLSQGIGKVGGLGLLRSPESILNKIAEKQGFNTKSQHYQDVKGGALSKIGDRRRSMAMSAGLIGGIALPMAAGAIDASKFGKTAGGRFASSSLQGAGIGLSAGSFFGLHGAAIGAVGGAAIGGISALYHEKKILKDEGYARRLEKASGKSDQVEIGNQIVQANARTKDLIDSGASQSIIQSNIDQVTELKSRLTNKEVSKIFEPRKGLSSQEEQDAQLSDLAREGIESERKKRYLNIGSAAENLSENFQKEKDLYTLTGGKKVGFSYMGGLGGGGNSKNSPFKLSKGIEDKKNEVLNEFASSASSNIKFKANEDVINKVQGGSVNDILNSLKSNVVASGGNVEEFEAQRKKLQEDYLDKLGDQDLQMEFIVKFLKDQKTSLVNIAKQEKDRSENLRKTIDVEKIKFNISQQLAAREISLFKAGEKNKRGIAESRLNLGLNSAFITDEAMAKRENALGLEESNSGAEISKQGILMQAISGITEQLGGYSAKSKDPSIFADSLDKLSKANNSKDFGAGLESLVSLINGDKDLKSTDPEALKIVNALYTLKTETINGITKIEEGQKSARLIAQETDKNISQIASQTRMLNSLGGLESLGKESSLLKTGGTPDSGNAYRKIREISAARGLTGGDYVKKAKDRIDLKVAQSNVATADLGETLGLTGLDMKASGAVNFDEIKKGRASSLRSSELDKAKSLAQDFLSSNKSVGGNLNLEDRISKAKTPEDIQKMLGGFGISDNGINSNRKQTLAQIGMLSDAYKNSDKKASDEVDARYKLGKTVDSPVVSATKDNTDAIKELTKKLSVAPIQNLNNNNAPASQFGAGLTYNPAMNDIIPPDVDFKKDYTSPSIITTRQKSSGMSKYDTSINSREIYGLHGVGFSRSFNDNGRPVDLTAAARGLDPSANPFGKGTDTLYEQASNNIFGQRNPLLKDFNYITEKNRSDKSYRLGETEMPSIRPTSISPESYMDTNLLSTVEGAKQRISYNKENDENRYNDTVSASGQALNADKNLALKISVDVNGKNEGGNDSSFEAKLKMLQDGIQLLTQNIFSQGNKIDTIANKTNINFPPSKISEPPSTSSNGFGLAGANTSL